MADGFIGLDPDGTGKDVDMSELTVNGKLVERERMVLSDDSDPLALTKITNSAPVGTEYGPVTRNIPSGVQAVSGAFFQATQPVSGAFFQATQPVSAVALPLPAGASTEATQLLVKAKTDNLDAALSTRATEATHALIKAKTDNLDVALSTVATQATLALIKAKTDNLDALLSSLGAQATLALVAKDATLGLVSDTPGAYTVLDRLSQIQKKLDTMNKSVATEATLKLVATALARPSAKPTTTLLHRSF